MNRDILLSAFNECDVDGSGFIGKDEVHLICDKFGIADNADDVFKDLDRDGDGQISFEDFCAGFSEFEKNNNSDSQSLTNNCKSILNDGSNDIKRRGFKPIPNDRNSRNVSQINSQSPPMFEEVQSQKIICELLENVRKLQEENNRLAQSWMRDKREHEEHLQHIEQEVDCQVREVENRVKQKAKEEIEADRKYFREMMKDEMNELQAHLSMFEKVEAWLKSNASNVNDEKFNDFRDQLNQTMQENRQMRLSLLDTQTAVAMMRTELAQLTAQYDSKCRELNSEKMKAFEITREHDELAKQLQLT
ncbi:ras and EF-hand domain-containing protein-like protein, partial [Leptotrombidium deliense]